QAEDGIRDRNVTGVQTCALPISATASAATATVAATLATLDRVVFSLMSSVFHASFRFALAQPRDRSIAGAARCAPDRRPSAEAGVRRARPGRAAGPTLDPVKRVSGTAVLADVMPASAVSWPARHRDHPRTATGHALDHCELRRSHRDSPVALQCRPGWRTAPVQALWPLACSPAVR